MSESIAALLQDRENIAIIQDEIDRTLDDLQMIAICEMCLREDHIPALAGALSSQNDGYNFTSWVDQLQVAVSSDMVNEYQQGEVAVDIVTQAVKEIAAAIIRISESDEPYL